MANDQTNHPVMLGICVEASHQRGLGHLFRMLNFSTLLRGRAIPFRFFMNADQNAEAILQGARLPYEIVALNTNDWQHDAIEQYGLDIWIDDRLDTSLVHARTIDACGLPRVTFDDRGEGASLAALNVAALCFDLSTSQLTGKQILMGPRYLVLNPEIALYRKPRRHMNSLVVSMGGSDTYGVTIRVVRCLKQAGEKATIILGPDFSHYDELESVLNSNFTVKRAVPSLVEEFSHHDLAITGGGITPFEANAAGLPCVVIANEDFEVPVALGIEALGGVVFAGHYGSFRTDCLRNLRTSLPLQKMSEAAMRHVDLEGAARVLKAIEGLA